MAELDEFEWGPVEGPDISQIAIDEDGPTDIYSEKQRRLLTEPLYSSWTPRQEPGGEPRTFVATANVGLFATVHTPPLVPDVLVSVDVEINPDFVREKRHRTYFIWEMGKPPEIVIEVVSNRVGGELGKRKQGYERIGVAYYVVWDPAGHISQEPLVAFERRGGRYVRQEMPPSFEDLGLSLRPWEGEFEGVSATWLRWHAGEELVLTGAERAEAERERAEAERGRADAERERADRLAALLREHGIDPESV